MTTADITRAIEAIWRIEAARLVAGLARLVRDVALAEDLAQDALVGALDQWPKQGVPDKPERFGERAMTAALRSFACFGTAEGRHALPFEPAPPQRPTALGQDLGNCLSCGGISRNAR
jgi:hypothetical protein